MKILFPDDMVRQASFSIVEIIEILVNPFEGANNEMWFIGTILWLFAFAPLWRWSCLKWQYELSLFVILVALYAHHPSSNWLCIRQVCTYSLFFYSGILICKHEIDKKAKEYKWLLLIGGALLYVISINVSLGLFATCFAIFFSVGLAFILDQYLPKTFRSFRDYTYQIFLRAYLLRLQSNWCSARFLHHILSFSCYVSLSAYMSRLSFQS